MSWSVSRAFFVCGLKGAGKTSLIQGLIQRGNAKGEQPAGFKPFETDQLGRNAREEDADGEIFVSLMQKEPNENLINPYKANEDYPVEMAFRRDGIQIKWDYVASRKQILCQHYDPVYIETPAGLFTPLTEDKDLLAWMVEWDLPILYVLSQKKEHFPLQLAEIELLKAKGLNYHLWLNNPVMPKDGDYLFYLWEKSEIHAGQLIEGMLPFIPEPTPESIAIQIEEHLPGLLKKIDEA